MSTAELLVSAVNGALAHLDQPPITSLDQETHAARTAKALWLGVLMRCLVVARWNFAESDFRPAAESATPDAEGWYIHPLPSACLQVVEIAGLGPREWKVVAPADPDQDHAAQARRLFCRALAPLVTGTWLIRNAGLWSPLFRQYFEFELAAAMAGPVARASEKAPGLREEARLLILPLAKRRDAQEGAAQQAPRETSWIAARRRGAR